MLVKRLTGSQGAGIGVGGTFLILFMAVGIYFAIRYNKKARQLKKTQSATSNDATHSSPAEKGKSNVATATTTNTTDTTDPRYNASSTLEMGTAEGNTHELGTRDNAHELPVPDRLHEMGDLAPEYGAEGDIHIEGDAGLEGLEGEEEDIYPQGDHGKYAPRAGGDEKAPVPGEEGGGDLKRRESTRPIAELEGDGVFPERRGGLSVQGVRRLTGAEGEAEEGEEAEGEGDVEAAPARQQQEEGKEGVGKGFVLTD